MTYTVSSGTLNSNMHTYIYIGPQWQKISEYYTVSRAFGDSCELFLLITFVYDNVKFDSTKFDMLLTVGYTMDTMYFNPLKSPIEIDRDISLSDFYVTEKVIHDCSQNYTSGRLQIKLCLIFLSVSIGTL